MIEFIADGDIFESTCDTLVVPVNCCGVMGAGLAKEFKKRFPWAYAEYAEDCANDSMLPGHVEHYWRLNEKPTIIAFPTKSHWKNDSRLQWIELGLYDLYHTMIDDDIDSIAIPALGCGLGGLRWKDVKHLIESRFDDLDRRIEVYEPH